MTRYFLTYKQLSILFVGLFFSIGSTLHSYAENMFTGSAAHVKDKAHKKKSSQYMLPNLDGSSYSSDALETEPAQLTTHSADTQFSSPFNPSKANAKNRKTQKQYIKDQLTKRFKWSLINKRKAGNKQTLSFNMIKRELVGKVRQGNMNYYFKASEQKAILAAQYRF